MKTLIALLSLLMVTTLAARAGDVRVTVMGTVVSNDVDNPPLGTVAPGERVRLSFEVFSNQGGCHETSPEHCHTPVDGSTFELDFESGVTVGLESPTSGLDLVTTSGSPWSNPSIRFSAPLSQRPLCIRFFLEASQLPPLGSTGHYDVTYFSSTAFDLWDLTENTVVAEFSFEWMLIEPATATPTRASSWGKVKDAFAEPSN